MSGTVHTEPVFVLPKYRSYVAVEVSLLRQLSDSLDFCGGSLMSAVILWANRPPEQKHKIFGEDHTMLPHVNDDLFLLGTLGTPCV